MTPSGEGTGPGLLSEPSQAGRAPSPGWGGFPRQRPAGGEGRDPWALIPQERFAASAAAPAPLHRPLKVGLSQRPGAEGRAPQERGGCQSPHGWRRPPPDPPRARPERRPGPQSSRSSPASVGGGRGSEDLLRALWASGGAGSRFPRGAARARLLPGPSSAGTAYLRALGAYGTAPTLLADAAAATAPPCCTAQGPTPARTLQGGRAAPERRRRGPPGIPPGSRLRESGARSPHGAGGGGHRPW